MLELSIFGTSISLALFSLFHPSKNVNELSKSFLVFGLVAFVCVFLASRLYRCSRSSRGGEATGIIMSLSLMNFLASFIDKITGSKAIPININISNKPYLPFLLAAFTSIFLLIIVRNKRISGLIKLARDNDSLLSSFGFNGEKIRSLAAASIAIISAIGFVTYISVQTTFSMTNHMQILIPSFAIAISIEKLNFPLLLLISFIVTYIEHIFVSSGSPILLKAYESLSFIAILLVVISIKKAINIYRLRRIYKKKKYFLVSE